LIWRDHNGPGRGGHIGEAIDAELADWIDLSPLDDVARSRSVDLLVTATFMAWEAARALADSEGVDWDSSRLRGIPVFGARGVPGALRGTQPEEALLAKGAARCAAGGYGNHVVGLRE
jgi:hypothetical protein